MFSISPRVAHIWVVLPTLVTATVSLLAFLYVSLRTYHLAFTYDESTTFLIYIQSGSFGAIWRNNPPSANNHLLNSWLMLGLYRLGGSAEWLLRLPNLLSFGLYVGGAVLGTRSFPPLVKISGFILLLANPYLLDFFGLARGYGLALGFTMLALGFTVQAIREERKPLRYYLLALLCLSLGVTANLALLHLWLAWVLVAGGYTGIWARRGNTNWRLWLGFVILASVLALLVGPSVAQLANSTELYFGGTTGFWADTVNSLIRKTLYARPYVGKLVGIIAVWVQLSAVGAGLWVAVRVVQRRVWGQQERVALVLILMAVLTVTILEAQHGLLQTRYTIERTATFFYPLYIVTLLQVLACLPTRPRWLRYFTHGVVAVFALLLVVHSTQSYNLRYVLDWRHDQASRAIVRDLATLQASGTFPAPVRVTAHWIYRPALDYYRTTYNYEWLTAIEDGATHLVLPDERYTDVILLSEFFPLAAEGQSSNQWRPLFTYPEVGVTLYTLQH